MLRVIKQTVALPLLVALAGSMAWGLEDVEYVDLQFSESGKQRAHSQLPRCPAQMGRWAKLRRKNLAQSLTRRVGQRYDFSFVGGPVPAGLKGQDQLAETRLYRLLRKVGGEQPALPIQVHFFAADGNHQKPGYELKIDMDPIDPHPGHVLSSYFHPWTNGEEFHESLARFISLIEVRKLHHLFTQNLMHSRTDYPPFTPPVFILNPTGPEHPTTGFFDSYNYRFFLRQVQAQICSFEGEAERRLGSLVYWVLSRAIENRSVRLAEDVEFLRPLFSEIENHPDLLFDWLEAIFTRERISAELFAEINARYEIPSLIVDTFSELPLLEHTPNPKGFNEGWITRRTRQRTVADKDRETVVKLALWKLLQP